MYRKICHAQGRMGGRLFTTPVLLVITSEEGKGDVMKVSQFGTLALIGVVVSFTVACSGSPLKPTAANPSLGNGASAASVNLSDVKQIGAADQICTGQPQALAEGEDAIG